MQSGGLWGNKAEELQRQSMMGNTVADLSSGTGMLDDGGGVCINGGHLNNNSIDIYTNAAPETTRQRCQGLIGICSVCTCT